MFSLCADFFALLVAFKNWSEQQNSVPGQSARNLLSSICNNSAKTCSNLQKFISICSFAFPSLIQNNYFDQRLLFKGKYVGLTPPLVARTRVGNMSPITVILYVNYTALPSENFPNFCPWEDFHEFRSNLFCITYVSSIFRATPFANSFFFLVSRAFPFPLETRLFVALKVVPSNTSVSNASRVYIFVAIKIFVVNSLV